MTVEEIITQLEKLKEQIWEYCDLEENYTQIKIKKLTNELLDYLEELKEQTNEKWRWNKRTNSSIWELEDKDYKMAFRELKWTLQEVE